jgi:23S rRNA (cytidine1920-2'-O)/16S rRNA (cytidine1409-2'-O)-methyltransferase
VAKKRLIDLVLSKRVCQDRNEARRLILSGGVLVNGHRSSKPAEFLSADVIVTLASTQRSVSRAGQKLKHAFDSWGLDVTGATTADIGAASGGFTECMLQHGAKRVYAIETGKGLLNWKLRSDSRVVVLEETNILHLDDLPEKLSFLSIDTSWTPLRLSLPHAARLLVHGGTAIALLKPNYEIQRPELLREGILEDAVMRGQVVDEFIQWASEAGWQSVRAIESPITGDKGNMEWLVYLVNP